MAQAARSLLIFKRRHLVSDFALLSKANFRFRQSGAGSEIGDFDLSLDGFTGFEAAFATLGYTHIALAAAQHCIVFEVSIVFVWIIQRVMEAPAFFTAQ